MPLGWSASPVPGEPFADALPWLVLEDEPSAWKATAPPAVMSRAVPDRTVWFEIVSPSASPTAASLPSASPDATDDADAVMCACASTLPVSVSAAPVPMVAVTETVESVIATAGVTPTVPPFAPVFASVVAESVPVAESARSWPPVSEAPSAIPAETRSVTMAIATEAPIPTFVAVTPDAAGSAFVVVVIDDDAVSATSPVPASALPRSSALVVALTMSSASEPATPTFPPPAPEVASASKTSPGSAVRVSPLEATDASAATFAVLLVFARLIATAAPMVTPVEPAPAVALPSAVAFASACNDECSVTLPFVVTWTPASETSEVDVAIVTLTAAATLIDPLDDEALGVLVEPEPPPPFAAEVESALLRSP